MHLPLCTAGIPAKNTIRFERNGMKINKSSKFRISPVRVIPLSFFLAILAGTLLLIIPAASAPGEKTDLITALFTSTTSVCVTGLVVTDTYAHWSPFGQLIILLLIQIGGLGVVSVGSMIMLAGKKKFSFGERKLLSDSLNVDKRRGLLSFLIRIFRGVFLVEGVGAVLYAVKFVPLLGFGKGLWASVFHAVSAFCNAGMDVVGKNSMMDFRESPYLMCVTMILIILGGLGFVVWFDLLDGIRSGIRRRFGISVKPGRLSEHSKLVLVMTAILLLAGTAGILAAEYHNPGTLGNMSLPGKILNSLFQSVTFRTAGFSSVPQENLKEISCAFGCILMFIGGSPVGTAGGVKTVTVFLILMNAYSYIKGKKESIIFHRKVSEEIMRKAAAIVIVSFSAVCVMTLLLLSRGGIAFTDALYEIVSALGTVGLSRGLTPSLDTAGKIIVIISMYLGRIGPISMAIFFVKPSGTENRLRHAEGNFYVG